MSEGFGSVLRELVVKLGFDVDSKALEGFASQIEKIKHGVELLTLAWDAAVVGAFEIVHETGELGHEIEATADVLGLTIEQYQKYRYAADIAGFGAENFTMAVSIMTRNIGEAVHGIGTAGPALRFLKVRFSDAAGKARATSDILQELPAAFARIKSPAEQARLSTEIFGRSGLRMGAYMARGGAELNKVSEEVEAFGFFTEDRIQLAEKAHGSFRAFFAIIKGIRNELGFRFAPMVTKVLDGFRHWIIAHQKLISLRMDAYVKKLGAFIEWGAQKVYQLVGGLGKLATMVGGTQNALELLGIAIATVFGTKTILAIYEMIAALAAADAETLLVPALIAGALALLLLALDDIKVWMDGGSSIIGDWLGPFDKLKEAHENILMIIEDVKILTNTLIHSGLPLLWHSMTGDWAGAFNDMSGMVGGGKDAAEVWPSVRGSEGWLHAKGFAAGSKAFDEAYRPAPSVPFWQQQSTPAVKIGDINLSVNLPAGTPQDHAENILDLINQTIEGHLTHSLQQSAGH